MTERVSVRTYRLVGRLQRMSEPIVIRLAGEDRAVEKPQRGFYLPHLGPSARRFDVPGDPRRRPLVLRRTRLRRDVPQRHRPARRHPASKPSCITSPSKERAVFCWVVEASFSDWLVTPRRGNRRATRRLGASRPGAHERLSVLSPRAPSSSAWSVARRS